MPAVPAVRPLAPLRGARPKAPDWFLEAQAAPFEDLDVEVEGARIEARSWGERGRPGIVFVHGRSAHIGWWSFLAPLFADRYRVAAFSLGGMGGSDWRRDGYSIERFAAETDAVIDAAGLREAHAAPIAIAHSMGGLPVLKLGARRERPLKAAILVDTVLADPADELAKKVAAAAGPSHGRAGFASLEDGLARFRLSPSQESENLYIVDHLARLSLGRRSGADGQGRWDWRVDPQLWDRLDRGDSSLDLAAVRCPLAVIRGERSWLSAGERDERMRRHAPPGTVFLEAPEAHHHVMIDQPLLLTSMLKTLLATLDSGGWNAHG